jgi:calcineurin-like phosphoesterase family protein
MNEALLENCRTKIGNRDDFLFLGDIVGSDGTRDDVWEWYGRLPEIDKWVRGNHDTVPLSKIRDVGLPIDTGFTAEYRGHSFSFTHKPHQAETTADWIIHGHEHNQKLEKYPFLDADEQRINISASLIGYEPMSMERLVKLIDSGQSYRTAP